MLKSLPSRNDKLSSILNNIRAIRKSRGYTQAYMAKTLKISPQSYNRKETGNAGMTLSEFIEVAEILKVEPIALIESA